MDEQQYILRLPEPLVQSMRFALSSTKRRDAAGEDKKASSFGVHFSDERNATFTVDGVDYPASLMDLPTLVETHKTADKRTFYKSGDLHQVLLVRMPGEPAPEGTVLKDGLTVAAKDAARRLAPPKRLFSAAQVNSVERRVKYVIDHKVKIVPKKDRPEDRPAAHAEEEEVVIEEETTVNGPTEKAGEAAQPPKADAGPLKPVAEVPPAAAQPVESVAKTVDAPTPQPEPVSAAPTPVGDVQPSPSPAVETPVPDGEGEGEPEENDDDFAEMAGALMEDDEEEARKRIERANLDQKIVEQKAKIVQIEEKAAKAPNQVFRTRILAKRGELQDVLTALEKERAELGED